MVVERIALSKMPKKLSALLNENGLISGEVLLYAEADMDYDCRFVHHVLILSNNGLIVGRDSKVTDELLDNKPNCNREYKWQDYSFQFFELARLSHPVIDEMVVGGVVRVTVDGVDEPICAFTNAYKNILKRLVEVLESLCLKKPLPSDRLFRENRIEVCPYCGKKFANPERRICRMCSDKRKIFFRLGSYFLPYKFQMFIMCLMSILTAVMSSVWPYLNGTLLYDGVLGQNREISVLSKLPEWDFAALLLVLALTMASCKLLQQLLGIIQGRAVARVVSNVVCTIKKKVFGSIQNLSVSFFTDKRTGGLMTRILADASSVSDLFIDSIPQVLPNLFTFVFSFAVMFGLNWVLALTAVIAMPIAALISFKLQPILSHFNSMMHQASRDYHAKMNDNLNGARVVRAFGTEEREAERLSYENDRVYNTQYSAAKFDVKFSLVSEIAKVMTALLTWGVGVCFVLAVFEPKMNYGELVTFTGYVSMLNGPANFFTGVLRKWSASMTAAQRIFEIIDAKPDVVETHTPKHPEDFKGEIKIEGLTFGYEENREVLRDINLTVKAGETLGIVGRSGAGKSTLANLITRLYDPQIGHIYFDGIDIRDMAFGDVRRSVAMVSQETYIFKGTVFDNIAYSDPHVDRKTVIEAAKAANAHDFICKLKDGYDTMVGTGGQGLSGGERQRISIARAILANPKILILDEATAAVDTETEKSIQEALERLSKGRTVLSIAHRISTLRNADKLIVIDKGRIVEYGTHDELIALDGTYCRLVKIQNEALKFRAISE